MSQAATKVTDKTKTLHAEKQMEMTVAQEKTAQEEKPSGPLSLDQRLKDRGLSWYEYQVLRDCVFTGAKTPNGVLMGFDYCRARKLDPFKKSIHIIATRGLKDGNEIWVETVWPGIGEVRTTAMRTHAYAGCDEVEFGPDATETFKGEYQDGKKTVRVEKTVTFPEWARLTVYRIVNNQRVAFPGPKVFYKEEFKSIRKGCRVPNDMWETRPYGQTEKCAEAAALRRGFPEETEVTFEEMQGSTLDMEEYDRGFVDETPEEEPAAVPPEDAQGEEAEAVEADIVTESEPQEEDLSRAISADERTKLFTVGKAKGWTAPTVGKLAVKAVGANPKMPLSLNVGQYQELLDLVHKNTPEELL